jgi:hypothetical protein
MVCSSCGVVVVTVEAGQEEVFCRACRASIIENTQEMAEEQESSESAPEAGTVLMKIAFAVIVFALLFGLAQLVLK